MRIARAHVRDVGRNGIKLWHGGELVNCLVHGTGADAAVVLEGGGDYRIVHTVVAFHNSGSSAYAVTVGYDSPTRPGTLEIVNSIFYRNSGAIWVSPATAASIRNSAFFGSANGQELVLAGPRNADRIFGRRGLAVTTIGPGVVAADPRFVAALDGDFHLQPASPARASGSAALQGAPDRDLHGRPRRAGRAPDMGVYEE